MSDLQQALALQGLLEQLGERIKEIPAGRSYLSHDGRAYVLAVGGDNAKEMHDFMKAVGNYLLETQSGRGNKEKAKAELMRAFEKWLSKQKV